MQANYPWANLLNPAQIVEIRDVFQKFDRDGSGSIDAKEIKRVMANLGIAVSDEQVTSMVDTIDVNRNGRLDFEEFLVVMARGMLEEDSRTELEAVASIVSSSDREGYTSIEVLRGLLTTAGQPLRDDEVDEMLSQLKSDADGYVSLDEFMNLECWRLPALGDCSSPQQQQQPANFGGGAVAPGGASLQPSVVRAAPPRAAPEPPRVGDSDLGGSAPPQTVTASSERRSSQGLIPVPRLSDVSRRAVRTSSPPPPPSLPTASPS